MSDVRMREIRYELDGKQYRLRCNMNVLADVQEAYDGDFMESLNSKSSMKGILEFLAAMLNDYADEMNWPERFTAKQLGRKLRREEIPGVEIMALVTEAVLPRKKEEADAEDEAKTEETEGNEGN
jgi:hypothetical protein